MSSVRATGRLAGVLYVLMGVTSVVTLLYLPAAFIVSGDATATARRITDAALTYRLAILSDLVSQILFLFLAWCLYGLLEGVDRRQAMLMVMFVSVAAVFDVVNLFNLIAPLILLSGAGFLSVFTKPQLDALALGFLGLRTSGTHVATAFWGLWLLPLGILVIKSGFIPRILGIFLIVACFAYLAETVAAIGFPAYAHTVFVVGSPFYALGELSIMIWLLVKGAQAPVPAAVPSRAS